MQKDIISIVLMLQHTHQTLTSHVGAHYRGYFSVKFWVPGGATSWVKFPAKILFCPYLGEYLTYSCVTSNDCADIPERLLSCGILGKLGKRKKANRQAGQIDKFGKWAM